MLRSNNNSCRSSKFVNLLKPAGASEALLTINDDKALGFQCVETRACGLIDHACPLCDFLADQSFRGQREDADDRKALRAHVLIRLSC